MLQTFGGQLKSRICCTICGHISDLFEPFFDLSISVDKQRTLRKAIQHFFALETLDGPDRPMCGKCERRVAAKKQLYLDKAPPVLTVHLKRFTPWGTKLDHSVTFPKHLNLTSYGSDTQVSASVLIR